MRRWEYAVNHYQIADHRPGAALDRELTAFQDALNSAGAKGWELVGYQSLPMRGWAGNVLVTWKRPIDGEG